MTWRREDTGKSSAPAHKGAPHVPAPPPAPVQPELLDAEGEPTMSVFQAMGIGEGESLFAAEQEEYPQDMVKELRRDFGWPSKKEWDMIRRMMTRDVEAV